MDTPALGPCPFCGGNDLSFRTEMEGIDYRTVIECTDYVVCGNCGAQGPPVGSTEMLWEDTAAAAAWNQRSAWQHSREGTEMTDNEFNALCDAHGFSAVARGEFPTVPRNLLKALVDAAVLAERQRSAWQPLPSPPPITP